MIDSRLKLLSTAQAVIEALDGGTAAARLAGCTPQNITNSLARGRLPARTFLIFTDELRDRGFRARASLWGIKERRAAAPRRGGDRQAGRGA